VPPYTIDRHQPARHESSQVKSPSHITTFVSQLTDEISLSTRRAVLQPPLSTSLIPLDHCFQRSSPKSLDYSLNVHLQTRSITACKFARSWPTSSSPNSLAQGLQVYLQTRSITISECISKFTRSRPPSVSPNTLGYLLQVHLQTRSIMAQSVSLSSLDHHFQARLELLSSTDCSRSGYTVCRWVAI